MLPWTFCGYLCVCLVYDSESVAVASSDLNADWWAASGVLWSELLTVCPLTRWSNRKNWRTNYRQQTRCRPPTGSKRRARSATCSSRNTSSTSASWTRRTRKSRRRRLEVARRQRHRRNLYNHSAPVHGFSSSATSSFWKQPHVTTSRKVGYCLQGSLFSCSLWVVQ